MTVQVPAPPPPTVADHDGDPPDEDVRATLEAERERHAAEKQRLAVELAKQTLIRHATGVLRDPSDAIAFLNPEDHVGASDEELAAHVAKLARDKPHLVAKRSPAGFDGGAFAPAPINDMNTLIRADLRRR